MQNIIFVSFGSNLGNTLQHIHSALSLLQPHVTLLDTSFLYETAPLYETEQPAFLNGCFKASTLLSPLEVLALFKKIESLCDRVKTIRNGPRTVDLDLLFYNSAEIHSETLTVPHPLLHERGIFFHAFIIILLSICLVALV